MDFTKIDKADLNSPRRELSNGGLKSVVTLLVCWKFIFLSAQTLTLNSAVEYYLSLSPQKVSRPGLLRGVGVTKGKTQSVHT